jgi:predicted MPP superfamily phosphohydrolase
VAGCVLPALERASTAAALLRLAVPDAAGAALRDLALLEQGPAEADRRLRALAGPPQAARLAILDLGACAGCRTSAPDGGARRRGFDTRASGPLASAQPRAVAGRPASRQPCGRPPREVRIIRLGHISDLHVAEKGRYPRHGFTARDCERYSQKLSRGLLEALREVQVDHVVVTGDVTLSGEAREFERAAELLQPFAEERKLTVVPGNHDLWSDEAVETARFLRALGPDGRGMRKAAPSYPHVVLLGEEAVLIALDSARYGEDPLTTPGRLGSEQLRSARALAREHSKAGRAVLLAFHHHVVLPPDRVPSDALVARMPLSDADQIVRLVAEVPVAAVLHGHRHTAFRVDLPGAAGPTPVLCAGSASRVSDEPVRRARAYVYEIDRSGVRSVEALVAGSE